MSTSRTHQLRAATTLPTCRAEIVHRFEDGWTIRTPQTLGDIHREGTLMSNCLQFDTDDVAELIEDLGGDWDADELEGDGYDAYRSLRDPDNLPHLTFRCNEDTRTATISEILGRHNSAPKPEHYARLCQWAADIGKPIEIYQPDLRVRSFDWFFPLRPEAYERVLAHVRASVC